MKESKPRLSKAERMEQIIHVAIEVIARDGFKEASTKEIAQKAACTEALIFKYFKTKEHILHHIVHTLFDVNDAKMQNLLDKENNFLKLLNDIVEWHVEEYSSKKDLYKVVVRHEHANVEFGKYIYEHRLDKRLKPLINECKKRKKKEELGQGVDCTILGTTLFNLLDSIKYKVVFLDIDINKIKKEYSNIFKYLLNAV